MIWTPCVKRAEKYLFLRYEKALRQKKINKIPKRPKIPMASLSKRNPKKTLARKDRNEVSPENDAPPKIKLKDLRIAVVDFTNTRDKNSLPEDWEDVKNVSLKMSF